MSTEHDRATGHVLELSAAYDLDPEVVLRQEPFGALAYHYKTRALTFVRSRELGELLDALASHPSLESALCAVGIEKLRWPRYERALASLLEGGMIRAR